MSRNPALFGFGQYPNLIGKSSCLVTVPATYESAALKAIHVQTDEPSEISRILTTNPEFTYWLANFKGVQRTVSGMAGVNISLSPNGFYRFLGGSATNPAYEYLAPSTIAASLNITGAVTAVDEPISTPDANFVTPTTTTSAWNARFTFPTPSAPPTTGTHMCAFVVRMLHVTGGTTTYYPKVTASLYESGVLKRNLGSRPVTVSTGDGQIFIFTFNPNELAAPDCSNVEVLIECVPGAGTGVQYAKLNTVALFVDLTSSFPSALPYDSGWIASPSSFYAGQEDDPPPTISVDYFPETPWTNVDTMFLLVMDDQALANPPSDDTSQFVPAGAVVNPPAGVIDLGVFAAGPALVLERGSQLGPESSVIVEGYEGVTEGGQSYGADAFRRRAMSVTFTLNRTEKDALMFGLDWGRGKSAPIYVNLDPNLPVEHSEFTAGWVTVAEAGAAVQVAVAYHEGDEMLFNKNYVFEERL